MTVLLTRPQADSERIAEELRSRGIASLIWPLSKTVLLADRVEVPPNAEALLFTSANGARAFTELSSVRELPALCVGGRTAAAAREVGLNAVHNADGDAAALARLAADSPYCRFFYPKGRETAADLATDLRAAGKTVDEAVVYGSNAAGPPDPAVQAALTAGRIAVATVWSRRNAALLAGHLAENPRWQIGAASLIAISDTASEPLIGSGFRRILVARRPNAGAMLEEIAAALRQ